MSEPLSHLELGGWVDPAVAYARLAVDETAAFWLDAGPAADSGWSWVGTGEIETEPERVRAVPIVQPTAHGSESGRFTGGWVGWLGYDDAARSADAPASDDRDTAPSPLWIRVARFIAFDHASRRAWAFAPEHEVREIAAAIVDPATEPRQAPAAPVATVARVRHTATEYAALIARCREAIRQGDAYQLCLTTRFDVDVPIDPAAAFHRLRTATPAHHAGLITAGPYALVSASPERFLEVDHAVVRTRPIKGTRPRGATAAADAALERELRESEKERAENVMIVDLMRNDLSRVCAAGSVRVEKLLDIESYPAVHQLVSTVAGDLLPGTTVGTLLDAVFPAGSMTGAPKLSAMTILHSLEGAPRGVFAGCFGWVGHDGAMDLAMVIRSIVTHPRGAYVGAGGGITWRSDAADEVKEVGVKARGPLAAIGATLPPGWDDTVR